MGKAGQRVIRGRFRWGTGLAVAMALLVGGCQGGPRPPENLQVVIATGAGSDQVVRSSLQRLATQMTTEFMSNNPGTNLHLRFLEEGDLAASVRDRSTLGAGPDVVISRVPPTARLSGEGLIVPSALEPEQLDPLRIQFLQRFRQGNQFRALPFLLQPSLACYNRERLPKPPATLDELVQRAAEGARVGLPLQMDDLLWSASGFGASRPLLQALDEDQGTRRPLSPADRTKVLAWLGWLYRANVQPTLQFVDTSDGLVQRLASRQLDWISCNATAIPQLRRSLGSRLAVALLPAGPNGEPAQPLARLLLLSFGRDSTPGQRRVAERFALFVLNDFSQNNLMVRAVGNMPVNQNVIVPVKESPQLATMQRSLENSIVPDFRQGIGLRSRTDELRLLLKQNVYGEQSPQKVLEAMEALANPTPERAP
jgi:ABC-type glycerol-3-phosphate transport system substrate-binding protein